jgi:hypothetical protein
VGKPEAVRPETRLQPEQAAAARLAMAVIL